MFGRHNLISEWNQMSHTSAAKESSIILRSAEGVFCVCLIDLKEGGCSFPSCKHDWWLLRVWSCVTLDLGAAVITCEEAACHLSPLRASWKGSCLSHEKEKPSFPSEIKFTRVLFSSLQICLILFYKVDVSLLFRDYK